MIKRTHTPKGQKTARAESNKRPTGRLVGIIAVRPKDLPEGAFNPLVIKWTVNPYRKDLNAVIDQAVRKGQKPSYSTDLFYSMFKKW